MFGADVTVVEGDLATVQGVDRLWAATAGRPVDALLANAATGWAARFSIRTSPRSITCSTRVLAEQHRKMAEPGSGKKAQ
jgi:hypothetical protein